MRSTRFLARWSGSPLTTGTQSALQNSNVPKISWEFLATTGLPSNALWFDRSNANVMCFDCIAVLRKLSQSDVSAACWNVVDNLGPMTIIGVHGSGFYVINDVGNMLMIRSGLQFDAKFDPDWSPVTFVNLSPELFAACLLSYKEMTEIFLNCNYDFASPAVRCAFNSCKMFINKVDPAATRDHRNYWFQILDHLDVW